MTAASRAAPPNAAAAISAAQDPVPDEVVGPTPRSQIRIRTASVDSTWANSTLDRAGKISWCSSAGPSRLNRASSGSGPSATHCGLPKFITASTIDSPAAVTVTWRRSAGSPIAARNVCCDRSRPVRTSCLTPPSV